MMNFLIYYQFPFLYLMLLIVGLAVFGSDFDTASGYIYTVPLLTFPFISVWGKGLLNVVSASMVFRGLCVIGGMAGILAYGPLHFGYWDEHSISQAILVSTIGICSFLLSASIASRKNIVAHQSKDSQIAAILTIAFIWLVAAIYPLFALFGLSLILILSAIWNQTENKQPEEELPAAVYAPDLIAKFMIFALAMDLGLVVWDYQVNTYWAVHLATTFIAMAIGIYIAAIQSEQLEKAVYIIACANFLLGILWPDYLITIMHSLIVGVALGYLLQRVIFFRSNNSDLRLSLGWIVWFFIGFALGYGLYANLAFAHWRFVFILPFLLTGVIVMAQNTLREKP